MHIQGGKGEKIQSSLVVQKPSLFSTPLLELSTKGADAAAARCSARNYENSFPNNKCSQLPVTKFHHHPSCHLREKQFVLNVEGWGGRGKKHLWSLSVSRKGSAKFEFFDSSFPKLSRILRPRRRAKRKRGEGPKKLGACGGGRRGNGCARKQMGTIFWGTDPPPPPPCQPPRRYRGGRGMVVVFCKKIFWGKFGGCVFSDDDSRLPSFSSSVDSRKSFWCVFLQDGGGGIGKEFWGVGGKVSSHKTSFKKILVT